MLNWSRPRFAQRRTQNPKSARLGLESLEQRQLLAGDVAVTVNPSGDVHVTGDEDSNGIVIASGETGLIIIGTENTNIIYNGESDSFHEVTLPEGVESVRDLRVDMQGGDDAVQLEDVHIDRSLKALLRQGDDSIGLENASVGGHATVSNGPGVDAVVIDFADVAGRLAVNGAEGDFDVTANNLTLGTHLFINAKDGNDTVNVQHSAISGDFVSTNTGGYDSTSVENSSVGGNFVSSGGDLAESHQFYYSEFEGDVTISTEQSSGANFTSINSQMSGDLSITNGDGPNSNYIGYYSSVYGSVDVTGGSNYDTFHISYQSYIDGNLVVSLGSGDDVATVNQSYIYGNLSFDLGAGNDHFDFGYASTYGSVSVDAAEGEDNIVVRGLSYDDETENPDARLDIRSGSDNDIVIVDSVFADRLNINLGSATFDGLFEEIPENLSVVNSSFAHATIRGFVGNRQIDVFESQFDEFVVQSSFGRDWINLVDIFAQEAEIRTGSGNDRVSILGESQLSQLNAALGSGEDEFETSYYSSFEGVAVISGGSGNDLANVPFEGESDLNLISFESIGEGGEGDLHRST